MFRRCFLLVMVLSLSLRLLEAGQFNQVLEIGDPAPAWTDLPGVDDAKHSLADLQDKQIVVVAFTCNSCPYAVDVEDRMIALQKKYADQGVAVIAINVNKVDEDLLPAMKAKSDSKDFPFSYLFDESQKIARDYGAVYTPEFYVLDRQRRVVYMGAMDDSPDGKQITKRYVEQAIEATLSNETPQVAETPPIGCGVRYERVRRTRRAPPR